MSSSWNASLAELSSSHAAAVTLLIAPSDVSYVTKQTSIIALVDVSYVTKQGNLEEGGLHVDDREQKQFSVTLMTQTPSVL